MGNFYSEGWELDERSKRRKSDATLKQQNLGKGKAQGDVTVVQRQQDSGTTTSVQHRSDTTVSKQQDSDGGWKRGEQKTEVALEQQKTDGTLESAIDNAFSIITKSYLDKLESYEIVKPSDEDVDIEPKEVGALYKLTKLVWNRDEKFLDKLTTIVNVVHSIGSSLVTLIISEGGVVEYYIGIVSKEFRLGNDTDERRRNVDKKAFSGALSGNMIGSDIESISGEELEALQKRAFGECGEKSISSVSGIVSLRNEEEFMIDSYVQGIENLVDSLQGMKYAILMIADPISTSEVQVIKQGYETLHTQLSTFRGSSLTMSESEAQSLSKARTKGITEGITKGVSLTQSKTSSTGKSKSWSANGGISVGVPFVVGVNAGVSFTNGKNEGEAETSGRTENITENSQQSQSDTSTIGISKTLGKSLQMNYENKTVHTLLDKIDKHLERLEHCESFGAFDCASYCFADTREEALAVASNYNAILRGKDSSVQTSHINTWYKHEDVELLHRYLTSFVHPRFSEKGKAHKDNRIIVSPASIISGNELAIQVGFPKKSVNGITVVPMAAFGRNMPVVGEGRKLPIGKLYHMGRIDGGSSEVNLDMESLTMHTFITGSTGAGKSTMIYHILDELMQREVLNEPGGRIKFLVIEPAKGEYKHRYGNRKDVFVYGSNPDKTPLLRINPFSFPQDIHVLEHIDRMIEIFNVCWPLYAAMPAVLKEAVERSYMAAGWDLSASTCKYKNRMGEYLYPTFKDVLRQIQFVMEESEYSADSKGDYKGALCTRIKSLTNGIYGQIFVSDEISSSDLFDENVIIDLSRIGSAESKALIMGLLVMKLQEYRMSAGKGMNLPVRHVTVLEEAHHILKRTSQDMSQDSANVAGKSVELLANSIAEMRTYGEGFVIADQSPGLMDMSVIRNTNTKIILRLPDLSDRELVGRAAGLSEEQILELSKLPTFVASIYQNNWMEPVLCKLEPKFPEKDEEYIFHKSRDKQEQNWKKYVSLLVLPIKKRNELDRKYVAGLLDEVYQMNVSAETKIAFRKYLTAREKGEMQRYRRLSLYGFFDSERAFSLSRNYEKDGSAWYDHMCETLIPDIQMLEEGERRRIIANLAMENAVMKDNSEARSLFEELMRNL